MNALAKVTCAGFLALLFLTPSVGLAQNLVVNGSFEERVGGTSGLLTAVDTSITGWTLTDGSIDWTGGLLMAFDGTYSIDLEGRAQLGAGTMEQTFTTVAGEDYHVSFFLAGNPVGGAAVKQVEVSVDNAIEQFLFDTTNTTTAAMGWVERGFDFVADGPSATLSFTSLLNSGFGPQIDLVSVEAIPLPGDGNGDGWVDGADFLLWAAAFATHPGPDGDISDGDYNDDGWIDGLDYLLWARNFGTHNSTAVPEPAALTTALLAFAGPLAVSRRRRRRA